MSRHIDSKSSRYSKATRFIQKTELAAMYKALRAYQELRRPALVAKFMATYRALEAVDFNLSLKHSVTSSTVVIIQQATWSKLVSLSPSTFVRSVPSTSKVCRTSSSRWNSKKNWRFAKRQFWNGVTRCESMGMTAVDALVAALTPDPVSGKSKKLYDTTITNLTEYLDTFTNRDLAGDAEYQEKVVAPLRSILKGVTMDKIRESQNLKSYVAKQVAAIKQQAAVLVQETGRKFR